MATPWTPLKINLTQKTVTTHKLDLVRLFGESVSLRKKFFKNSDGNVIKAGDCEWKCRCGVPVIL